jgi:hypothetical protein
MLILSTALPLLMQLISHTAAAESVESFGMPPAWRKDFVRMFFRGTKVFSWVAVYLIVSLQRGSVIISGVGAGIKTAGEWLEFSHGSRG